MMIVTRAAFILVAIATSFEQCMMTARGSGGFCVQNPWYLQYGSGQKGPEGTGRRAGLQKHR
jgi:hypothetical protein